MLENRLNEFRKEQEVHPDRDHWNAQVLTDLMWSDKKLRKRDSVRVCKKTALPGK